jgi:2,3-bisphosphoglycerate-independent phosphoglycerate mutase
MMQKVGLIILDGWGIGDQSKSDAIYNSKTPYMDSLLNSYPNATLLTCGEHVGLPEGQMGNSEVGHMNIGAGRIVYQELTRINKSIKDGDFFQNQVLNKSFEIVKEKKVALHIIGLVSKGGVHSNQEHIYAICQEAKRKNIEEVYIHAFTDGRDCDPNSGLAYIQELEKELQKSTGKIASVIGRFYAMDRDNRWERVKKAYDLLVHGNGKAFHSATEAIQESYTNSITDEFIEPSIITENGCPIGLIKDGDVVISINFRTDRPREIVTALCQKDFPEHSMQKLDIHMFTMTNYDDTFSKVHVLFEKDNLSYTLGQVLCNMEKTQVRIAETEKYPHVTFFFNGGREIPFPLEERIMVNSPKVLTYDLKPEMSALEIRDKIIDKMNESQPDFFCLNFANPDMVGHTGVYEAIVKAVETVDSCLQSVVESGLKLEYEFLVIADHGNADFAINPDGTANTAHSLNPVPMVLVSKNKKLKLKDGILADVAPTILSRMGISSPIEMTGKSLIQ